MGRAKSKRQADRPPEYHIAKWLVVTAFWRLPRLVFRLGAWLVAVVMRFWPGRRPEPDTGDAFYRSYRWRRLRVDALEANRQRYGMLACECCGMIDGATFHVDHIYPRSTHPDLALDPTNLQVLCDACNIGKGTAYTTNWRGGADPVPAKQRGWRRFLASR